MTSTIINYSMIKKHSLTLFFSMNKSICRWLSSLISDDSLRFPLFRGLLLGDGASADVSSIGDFFGACALVVAVFADGAALRCSRVVTPTGRTEFGFSSMASTLVFIPPKICSDDSSISRTATALA